MDNPLFVNERKSSSDLFRPSIYCFKDSRIPGFCWRCFWVIKDLTLQASFALFHYQDHSCGALFLEKGCAIKLYNVRMLQFSDKQNNKKNMQHRYKYCKICFIKAVIELSCVFLSNHVFFTTSFFHTHSRRTKYSGSHKMAPKNGVQRTKLKDIKEEHGRFSFTMTQFAKYLY